MKLMKFIIMTTFIFSWGEAFARLRISHFNHGTECTSTDGTTYSYEDGEVVEEEGECRVRRTCRPQTGNEEGTVKCMCGANFQVAEEDTQVGNNEDTQVRATNRRPANLLNTFFFQEAVEFGSEWSSVNEAAKAICFYKLDKQIRRYEEKLATDEKLATELEPRELRPLTLKSQCSPLSVCFTTHK